MKCYKVLIGIFGVPIIILGWHNFKTNTQFWDTSVYQIVNLLIIVFISFYLTQQLNHNRKHKESICQIIAKIQDDINDKDMYCISECVPRPILLLAQRRINNKIDILLKDAKKFRVEKDLIYIKNTFDTYCEFVGNHLNDNDYLSKSTHELKSPLDLIDDRLDTITLKLFKS